MAVSHDPKFEGIEETHLKLKVNSLFIESVKNGFIVYENERRDHYGRNPMEAREITERLVFNTKDQLNQYINENL